MFQQCNVEAGHYYSQLIHLELSSFDYETEGHDMQKKCVMFKHYYANRLFVSNDRIN